ncbi:MAG: efflux RND transporter periplasmic adaptor subunit [Halieaceae bacterium]
MQMYSKAAAACLSAMLFITACAEEDELRPMPVRPVKTFTVGGADASAQRRFPGVIEASQRADVSFRLPGTLQEILVNEGEVVEKDQLLARLDPTDFKLRLENQQAKFDNSSRNFKRAESLVTKGAISRMDYDRMEAEYRSLSATLKQAKQDLDYTQLRAPFDGVIASRAVDNFQDVLAKQTIFRLQNIDQLDVRISVPENLIGGFRARTRTQAEGSEGSAVINALAYFEARPEDALRLQFKELATKADQQTQTFRVTFTMPAPEEFLVLPGMTVNVGIDFPASGKLSSAMWVPLYAVQADSALGNRVWILDPATMTVSSQSVKVAEVSGDFIQVVSGLEGGEEIVSIGADYLAEGMKVSRMRQREQAAPRADDPT